MPKKILILAASGTGITPLIIQAAKEQHGADVEIYTPESAKKSGIKPSEFDNIPTHRIFPRPILEEPILRTTGEYQSGRDKRRERRKCQKK